MDFALDCWTCQKKLCYSKEHNDIDDGSHKNFFYCNDFCRENDFRFNKDNQRPHIYEEDEIGERSGKVIAGATQQPLTTILKKEKEEIVDGKLSCGIHKYDCAAHRSKCLAQK